MVENLELITEKDAFYYFRNNLGDLVKTRELRDYLANLMVKFFVTKELSVFFDGRSPLEKFEHIWHLSNDEAYKQFTDLGNAYVWLCGVYPPYMSQQRKSSLGLPRYSDLGRTSFEFAVSVGNKLKDPSPRIGIISKLGRNFEIASRSIFEMQRRIDPTMMLLHPEIIEEISATMYGGKPLPKYQQIERPSLRIV